MLLCKILSTGLKSKSNKKPAEIRGWLAYCSTLKTDSIFSSETSRSFWTTWPYNAVTAVKTSNPTKYLALYSNDGHSSNLGSLYVPFCPDSSVFTTGAPVSPHMLSEIKYILFKCVRFPSVQDFSLLYSIQPTQPPIQWVLWNVSPGVKRQECEAHHSPTSSAKAEPYLHCPIRVHVIVLN
jgi:hypothetical protein